jgi:hypothetical protein
VRKANTGAWLVCLIVVLTAGGATAYIYRDLQRAATPTFALPTLADFQAERDTKAAQRQARREPGLAWYRRTTVGAFDQWGAGRPWAADGHRAVAAAYSQEISGEPGTGDEEEIAGDAAAAAVDAGCDDPLVLQVYGRSPDTRDGGGDDEQRMASAVRRVRATVRAADRFGPSKYPPARRCLGLLAGAEAAAAAPEAVTGVPAGRAKEYAAAAEALFPEVAADRDMPLPALLQLVREVGEVSLHVRGDRDAMTKPLLEALRVAKCPRTRLMTAWGEYLTARGWDARGGGWGNQLGSDGASQFHWHLNVAAKSLDEAWQLDHANADAAAAMITVLMGQAAPNKGVDLWYDRAMAAEPWHAEAISRKMLYLEPKWHGSVEELREFARQLAENERDGAAATRQLLAPADARWRLAEYVAACRGDPPAKYFSDNPLAWTDIDGASTNYLAAVPQSRYHRTRYAIAAAWTKHWTVAASEFERLGDAYSRTVVSPAEYAALRDRAYTLTGRSAKNKPATAPVSGELGLIPQIEGRQE